MQIRPLEPADFPAYHALCTQLDEETIFRLYEPDERPNSLETHQKETERFLASSQNIILVAEKQPGVLVGYLQAIGREPKRIRHVISVNIGILQAYTGKGIGGRLFSALEEWAKGRGVRRIDLTVMENNAPAQKLYHRLGFEVEGIKRRSMRIENEYVDEIYMSKWLL